MPKNKRFTPLHPRTSDSDLSHKHQLARLLMATEFLESPSTFVQLAISQSLGPLLLHHLTQTNTALLDFTQMQALKTDVRENMVLYLIQERAMFEVNHALATAGIKCIWLKGVALGHTLYPEPHLRVKGDLDCIVPLADFPAALDILHALNYHQLENLFESEANDRLSHHIHLMHNQYPQLRLELHHRLLGHSGRDYISPEHLARWLEQTMRFEVNQQPFFTLKPEHHILYLCAHGFLQHGESFVGLRDLLDLHLLLTTYDLNWDAFVTEAVELRWTYLVTYVFNLVQDYFNTPIPLEVFESLRLRGKEDEFMSRIVLKRYGDTRGESVLQYLGQLSFRERVKTIFQIIFPPKRYMRQRYAMPSNRSTLPYYVYRILDQSKGVSVAILRRIGFHGKRLSKKIIRAISDR